MKFVICACVLILFSVPAADAMGYRLRHYTTSNSKCILQFNCTLYERINGDNDAESVH